MVFLATSDAESARKNFYQGKHGLTVASDDPFALVYQLAETELRLSKAPNIIEAHGTLAELGVELRIYEGMGQHKKGIWASPDGGARILWFKKTQTGICSPSQNGPRLSFAHSTRVR